MEIKEYKKQKFWKWFESKKDEVEKFISTRNQMYFSAYIELTDCLIEFDPHLIAELAMEGDRYVLIISCDGISTGIEPVQELVKAAPRIPNWEIRSFRQPCDHISLSYKGLELDLNHFKVNYRLGEGQEKVNITYRIEGYDKTDNRFNSLGFLYLDHVIGEYNVMTKVGSIEFEELKDNIPDMIGLIELRNVIEQNLLHSSYL